MQEAWGASHVRLWLSGRAECLWQRRPDAILDCVWRVYGRDRDATLRVVFLLVHAVFSSSLQVPRQPRTATPPRLSAIQPITADHH